MKTAKVMSTIRAVQILSAVAMLGLGRMAGAQLNGDLKAIKLSQGDLQGYSLLYEGERDWALFTSDSGAPAQCLQSKPFGNGTEQIWRRVGREGRLRIDYAVLGSPGEAIAAANAAALLINNATAKVDPQQAIGDSAWRTIAGSATLIVQRGAAVISLAGQGNPSLSEAELKAVAGKILERVDGLELKMSPQKLACDIQVYLGLNLIQSQQEKLQGLARDLERGGAAARSSVVELKALIQAEGASGMQREAAINLMRAANSITEGRE